VGEAGPPVERLSWDLLGFARWRLQRELWRRDVERLTCARQPDQA
jgi:hypothetical protein